MQLGLVSSKVFLHAGTGEKDDPLHNLGSYRWWCFCHCSFHWFLRFLLRQCSPWFDSGDSLMSIFFFLLVLNCLVFVFGDWNVWFPTHFPFCLGIPSWVLCPFPKFQKLFLSFELLAWFFEQAILYALGGGAPPLPSQHRGNDDRQQVLWICQGNCFGDRGLLRCLLLLQHPHPGLQ